MNEFLTLDGVFKLQESNLHPTSFSIQQFQKTAIMGETGSGKSTVMKIIGGLSQPDGGEAFFLGKKIQGPNDKLIPGHPGIAYLSQHFELFNNYFVHELLEYSSKMPDAEAAVIFKVCKIEHLLERKTDKLSGGERQRIALARQLVRMPKLLLLDEPFSNLDMANKRIIKQVIHDISSSMNITCILVSHDPEDVLSWADQVLIFQEGRLIQQGAPEAIYFNPVNEYAASLTGDYNTIETSSVDLRKALGIHHDQKVLVRPEQLNISAEGIPAQVVNSIFCGDHVKLEVRTSEQVLTIFLQNGDIKLGDVVHISKKS